VVRSGKSGERGLLHGSQGGFDNNLKTMDERFLISLAVL